MTRKKAVDGKTMGSASGVAGQAPDKRNSDKRNGAWRKTHVTAKNISLETGNGKTLRNPLRQKLHHDRLRRQALRAAANFEKLGREDWRTALKQLSPETRQFLSRMRRIWRDSQILIQHAESPFEALTFLPRMGHIGREFLREGAKLANEAAQKGHVEDIRFFAAASPVFVNPYPLHEVLHDGSPKIRFFSRPMVEAFRYAMTEDYKAGVEMMKIMKEVGVSLDSLPLGLLAESRHVDMMAQLLEWGVEPDQPGVFHAAMRSRNLDMTRVLLSYGGSPWPNYDGRLAMESLALWQLDVADKSARPLIALTWAAAILDAKIYQSVMNMPYRVDSSLVNTMPGDVAREELRAARRKVFPRLIEAHRDWMNKYPDIEKYNEGAWQEAYYEFHRQIGCHVWPRWFHEAGLEIPRNMRSTSSLKNRLQKHGRGLEYGGHGLVLERGEKKIAQPKHFYIVMMRGPRGEIF